MEWLLVVLLIALFIFCIFVAYRIGYIKGYNTGASKIVHIWKGTLQEIEDEINEKIH